MTRIDWFALLEVAIAEAERGLATGGLPIGAALFDAQGNLLGKGHNRLVQDSNPSLHAEISAFQDAGRLGDYRDTIMVTTLAPCWYCSGLVRQFQIGTLVVGEAINFFADLSWLRDNGTKVIELGSNTCVRMLERYIAEHPKVWHEDISHHHCHTDKIC